MVFSEDRRCQTTELLIWAAIDYTASTASAG